MAATQSISTHLQAREQDIELAFNDVPYSGSDKRPLEDIAYMMTKPPEFTFKGDEQDEIANGGDTYFYEEAIELGLYLDRILPAIEWWMHILSAANEGARIRAVELKHAGSEAIALLGDIFAAYASAFTASARFTGEFNRDHSAAVELVRRYRRFTRHICDYAQKVWPDVHFINLRRVP